MLVSLTSPVLCWEGAYAIVRNTKSSKSSDRKRKHERITLISNEVFGVQVLCMLVVAAGKMR